MSTTSTEPSEDVKRGARAKRARELAGLTQRQAADIFGVDKDTVSRWERGAHAISIQVCEQMAAAYSADKVFLTFGIAHPAPSRKGHR